MLKLNINRKNLFRTLVVNSCLLGSSVFAASGQPLIPVADNDTVEVKTLHHFAVRGDVSAQLALARYYESHRQTDRGGMWYKRAALNGNAEAQFQYGLMCLDEEVDCKDREEGIFWVEQAAAQGHHQARVVASSLLDEDFTIGC